MRNSGKSRFCYSGFALPMVIIAIAGLTLIVVGLLTVVALERKTARSYSEATRADFALESGLAVALASLTEIVRRDDAIVFRVEDPIDPKSLAFESITERPLGYREKFFTYGAIYEGGKWRGIPLFSGGAEGDLGQSQIRISEEFLSLLEGDVRNSEVLSPINEHDQNIPQAEWVSVRSSTGDGSAIRYSFWVEDLSGRLDGKNLGKLSRASGTSTAEIDVSTMFDPISEKGKVPDGLLDKSEKLVTSASVRGVLASEEAKRIEPYLYFLPPPKHPSLPNTVPQGFDYVDAGKAAPYLGDFLAREDVNGIASHIRRNLPDFEQRRGGFPDSQNYLRTLAASIIDYADADRDATTGADYRGVDSYPFVNELFDRYEWSGGSSGNVEITVETYIELWNPTQQTISGNLQFRNLNQHKIAIPLVGTETFDLAELDVGEISILPNGFSVILAGSKTYTFATGAFPPSSLSFEATTESSFELLWNGAVVDRAFGGLQRTGGTLRPGSSQRKWKGNASPAHDSSIGQSGDPRASFYIGSWVYANSYDTNSNWGGRSLKRSITEGRPYREVRVNLWADSGSNSEPGTKAGTDSRRPYPSGIVDYRFNPYADYPPHQPTLAPAFISNKGRYQSLAELGNIFDPAQWDSVESPDGVPSSAAGGGFSLAIGRPEFPTFDRPGLRAAQLIDLFSIDRTSLPDFTASRPININTAPREVLRALVAGIDLEADPAAPDVILKHESEVGDRFADFVIEHRSKSPFRSHSDFANLRRNPLVDRDYENPSDTPFFGNPDYFEHVPLVEDAGDQLEWDDVGREELFRKVMDLVSFRSNIFRIVVKGEAVGPTGKVVGRRTKEFHYAIEPERYSAGDSIPDGSTVGSINPDGAIELQKLYEKSF